MPAVTQEISEALIRDNINRAVCDVFKTMLHRTAKLDQATASNGATDVPPVLQEGNFSLKTQVVGTVGFLGDINGLIYLYFEEGFAKECTGHLLGMSMDEVTEAGDEVINDAIGEVTNMTVGSFKNGLSDQGYPCKLTIPSILRGSNFSIEPISDSLRFIYSFETEGQRLIADIILKVGE
jgi:chemotaxis protein CheX